MSLNSSTNTPRIFETVIITPGRRNGVCSFLAPNSTNSTYESVD